MPTASVDLPFAIPAKEREKAFTSSMEATAILLLAEARRRKRGLFGTAPAKLVSVSKLHYPLWAVPWANQFLIVDALAVSPSTIAKLQLPNITGFIEDVERGASVRELFRNAIEKHAKTFSDYAEKLDVQVDALLIDKTLLSDLSDYVQEASSSKSDAKSPITLVPPKLDVKSAGEITGKMQSLHVQGRSEIASLVYAKNLLEEITKRHEQMIMKEANFLRETYEAQIAELKPVVERKTDQLLKERDTRIAKMSKIAQSEMKVKEREKGRRERELQKLALSEADFVRKREARRRRHDKTGEAHWEHRIRANEKRISEVKAKIQALAESIEKARMQNEVDTEKLRQGYQWLIDQERRKVTDIEFQRDEALETKRSEIEALKLGTGQTASQLQELTLGKEKEAEELRTLAISSQFNDVTLLCLPLYLVCYQTEETTQFHVLPPVKVMSLEGVLGAIRRKLGGIRPVYKVKLFMRPRSKALSKMLDFAIKEKMKSDKAFSESLREAAVSSNILLKDDFKEILTRGMVDLKAEDWITQKEEDLIRAHM